MITIENKREKFMNILPYDIFKLHFWWNKYNWKKQEEILLKMYKHCSTRYKRNNFGCKNGEK